MNARLAACAAALACAACLQVGYRRQHVESVPGEESVARLAAGASTLSDALAQLGAPLDVWEGAGGGPVLAYGGMDTAEWAVTVSVPVTDYSSASFSYADFDARTRGVVLLFDADLVLTLVRRGYLRDLRQETRRRAPAVVEEDG